MKILAFDTAFSTCSVGLSCNGRLFVDDRHAPMQQSRLILPIISDLFHQSNSDVTMLDAIAYGCGPGSFTGVRIAQSVAQGMGFAANKPLIPISSLAILAQSAWMNHGWKKIVVCVDARMGQVYWAEYELHDEAIMKLVGEEQTCKPDDIPAANKAGWHGVGNGWAAYPSLELKMNEISLSANAAGVEPQARAILALAENVIMSKSV